MARKPKYPTRQEVETTLQTWTDEHSQEIIDYLLNETGYNSFEELKIAEHNMRWGLDCGFVYIIPQDYAMSRQWAREYWDRISITCPFNCQSTTLVRKQTQYVIDKLGLNDMYYVSVVLD